MFNVGMKQQQKPSLKDVKVEPKIDVTPLIINETMT